MWDDCFSETHIYIIDIHYMNYLNILQKGTKHHGYRISLDSSSKLCFVAHLYVVSIKWERSQTLGLLGETFWKPVGGIFKSLLASICKTLARQVKMEAKSKESSPSCRFPKAMEIVLLVQHYYTSNFCLSLPLVFITLKKKECRKSLLHLQYKNLTVTVTLFQSTQAPVQVWHQLQTKTRTLVLITTFNLLSGMTPHTNLGCLSKKAGRFTLILPFHHYFCSLACY